VNLRLVDNTTDAVWRALFNELATKPTIDAEAMGSRTGAVDRTVIVLRLGEGATPQLVEAALDEVGEIARRADRDVSDRRRVGTSLTHAAAEWWRRWERGGV
jgi:hypothetical protein